MDAFTEEAIYQALFDAWSDDENQEEIKKVQQTVDIQHMSPVDPRLELLDPNPNIHALFQTFNVQFFWGKLCAVEVKWSPRMTQCAGICRYRTESGYCTIGLSRPLLTLRPRKDLVETLIHEMIHAYLFVTHDNRDRDDHGPNFHQHMYRINAATGAAISVYHTFYNEVRAQKVHVWRCQGVCRDRHPFYGYLRRSMNRAPGKHDTWYAEHQALCGGQWEKIQEPANYVNKKSKKKAKVKTPGPSIVDLLNKSDTSPLKHLPVGFKIFSGKGIRLGSSQSPGKKLTVVKIKTPPSLSNNQSRITAYFGDSPVKKTTTVSEDSHASCPEELRLSDEHMSDSELLILDKMTSPPSNSAKRKRVDPPTTNPLKTTTSPISSTILPNSSTSNPSQPKNKHKIVKPPTLKIVNPTSKTNQKSDITKILNSPSRSIPCPICDISGFVDINAHVQSCLDVISPDIITSIDTDEQNMSSRKRLKYDDDDDVFVLPDPDVQTPALTDRHLPCPICGKSGFNDINFHLNVCLESIPSDFDDVIEEKGGNEKKKDELGRSEVIVLDNSLEEVMVCPVCGTKIIGDINKHLDTCLTLFIV